MQEIKVVIFDFDNTLYRNITFDDWRTYCNSALRELLSFLSLEEMEEAINNQQDYSDISIIKTLKKYNISYNVWLNYRDNNLRNCNVDNAFVVSNETIKQFAKNYVLYIATFNTRKHVESVGEKIGLDLSFFKDIITVDYKNEISEKSVMYSKIAKRENVNVENLFVIGDKFESDVEPMLNIGGKGKVVENTNFKLEDFDL